MIENEPHAESFDCDQWDQFCDKLKQAGQQILSNCPDDGLDKTEGFRYLSRLTQNALARCNERPNPLKPTVNYNSPKIGCDNPDFVYGSISISGKQVYRLCGNRRDAYNIGFGSYYGGLGSNKGLQCSGYCFLNDLEVDQHGNFELIISGDPHDGNWLPVEEQSNAILIRQTVLNRGVDCPAELHIELLNADSSSTRATPLRASEFSNALQLAGLFVGGVVNQFLGWTNNFKQRPNQIHPIDPALLTVANGDPSTRYHYGFFELKEHEVLLIELDPPACEYWNIQLANYWLESLDYLDYQTHFNHANATVDADGKVRLVVSPCDPEVSNWMDTGGHQRGCIALRWVKSDRESLAKTNVVTIDQLRIKPLSALI